MANMNDGSSFSADITLTKQTGTVVKLATSKKYVNKPIEINLSAQTDSISVKGAELSDKSSGAVFTNMTTSSTDTSGISIQTNGSAGRQEILLNGSINGWVSENNEASISPALPATSWNGTKYYATGVTLTSGKAFDITVPNGSGSTITFHFAVDNNGNTTITGGD